MPITRFTTVAPPAALRGAWNTTMSLRLALWVFRTRSLLPRWTVGSMDGDDAVNDLNSNVTTSSPPRQTTANPPNTTRSHTRTPPASQTGDLRQDSPSLLWFSTQEVDNHSRFVDGGRGSADG